jgi:tagatose-1,6-bisphosphate aldolase non-catalytic subunit AgaZ/GatZ
VLENHRVRIVLRGDWQPNHWYDDPPSDSVEYADEGLMTEYGAEGFVFAYNEESLAKNGDWWAVMERVLVPPVVPENGHLSASYVQ